MLIVHVIIMLYSAQRGLVSLSSHPSFNRYTQELHETNDMEMEEAQVNGHETVAKHAQSQSLPASSVAFPSLTSEFQRSRDIMTEEELERELLEQGHEAAAHDSSTVVADSTATLHTDAMHHIKTDHFNIDRTQHNSTDKDPAVSQKDVAAHMARMNEISAKLGTKMLQGYTLLGVSCPQCQCPLVQHRKQHPAHIVQRLICVNCGAEYSQKDDEELILNKAPQTSSVASKAPASSTPSNSAPVSSTVPLPASNLPAAPSAGELTDVSSDAEALLRGRVRSGDSSDDEESSVDEMEAELLRIRREEAAEQAMNQAQQKVQEQLKAHTNRNDNSTASRTEPAWVKDLPNDFSQFDENSQTSTAAHATSTISSAAPSGSSSVSALLSARMLAGYQLRAECCLEDYTPLVKAKNADHLECVACARQYRLDGSTLVELNASEQRGEQKQEQGQVMQEQSKVQEKSPATKRSIPPTHHQPVPSSATVSAVPSAPAHGRTLGVPVHARPTISPPVQPPAVKRMKIEQYSEGNTFSSNVPLPSLPIFPLSSRRAIGHVEHDAPSVFNSLSSSLLETLAHLDSQLQQCVHSSSPATQHSTLQHMPALFSCIQQCAQTWQMIQQMER